MKHTPLYPYQKDGVRQINWFDGVALLGDDTGLGKTIQSLYYAWKYLPADPPGPIVVVCPPTIKINWQREARRHLGLYVEVLRGEAVPPDKPPGDPNQIYVIGYKTLQQPNHDGQERDVERDWVTWLIRQKPRLVIGDEVHFCKNRASQRTQAFRRLCKAAPRKILMSATPLTKSPLDLWPALNILAPKVFPSSFSFACEYTHARKRPWGWEFKGARNLDKLHALLRDTCLVRRTKAEVLSELPQKTRSVIPIEVDLREYRAAEEDFLGYLAKADAEKVPGAASAEALTKINYLKRLAGRLKVDGVVDWVGDFLDGNEGKLLLGALHYRVTEPLHARFRRVSVLVDGRLTDTEKQVCFDKFNFQPSVRLMVANQQAAGTGWSCKATSDVAVVELPWTPGDLTQFEDRIYGLERGVPGTAAHIRYLVAAGTIEEDLCRILQDRQAVLDTTLDGTERDDSWDVYEKVKEAIRRRAGRRKSPTR